MKILTHQRKCMTAFFATILLMFINMPTTAKAGISAHGSEFRQDEDNVWFLGDAPVEYCVEASRSFILRGDAPRRVVREALNDWVAFFKKYGLDKLRFSGLKNGSLGLALSFVEVPQCNNPQKQLRILLGVADKEVDEILKFSPKTFGIAVRGEYDHQTYRNGGILWLPNMPYGELAIKHFLLHELGHIFGMAHGSVAIMKEDIANEFLLNFEKVAIGEIEGPYEKFTFGIGDAIDYKSSALGERSHCLPFSGLDSLKTLVNFPDPRCQNIKLAFDGVGEGANNFILSLTVTDKTDGTVLKMQGSFSKRYYEPDNGFKGSKRGPALYTQRFCAGCGLAGRFDKQNLYQADYDLPLEGFFEYDNTIFPATINKEKNQISLRVFSPEAKRWWSVEPYLNSL